MAGPRKVFRIEEEMIGPGLEPQIDDPRAPLHAEIMHELAALRGLLAAAPPRQGAAAAALPHSEIERVTTKLRLIRSAIAGEPEPGGPNGPRAPAAGTTRIAKELEAVIKGCEQATQKILAAAEEIDQAANNLSAVLKGASEQGLAQDIRDRVISIFEACNFQDLTSQRVAKVLAAFGGIEQQVARVLDELTRDPAPPVHGPRLESDRGHVSQSDVDTMFGGSARSA
jgi:chemotaxis protein CheZ